MAESELELPFTKFTRYPLLPLRDLVAFPRVIIPMLVGRDKSIQALEAAMRGDKMIVVATQRDPAVDDPEPKEIHHIGTLCTIFQHIKLPDGTVKVLFEGIGRVRISTFLPNPQYLEVLTERVASVDTDRAQAKSLAKSLIAQFENYVKLHRKIPPEVMVSLAQLEDPDEIADTIAAHIIPMKVQEKQKILETIPVPKRLDLLFAHIESEIGVLQMERKIKRRVHRQIEKSQREYYLNEQMKAIQKELGDIDDAGELDRFEKRIKKVKLPKEVKERANAEVKKLRNMSLMSAEATVSRNWLDTLLDLPWGKVDKPRVNLEDAQKILDEDHYGLEKVKERIIEHIAVQERTGQVKGPILCLVGPPGVGKTSLGQSIARAVGRKYVRASLGGVRDEAEIRGHRRTYIGSMPGRIIQSMKKAGVSNPLFLLDEIDKLGDDYRGDPAAALLEVLDPAQNSKFADHYLEVDYDLSRVMFIATANSTDLPQPLLDRMEVIRLSGYTEDEKSAIARGHLIPKEMAECGLKEGELTIDDAALTAIIRHYTYEAGVRNLEREIAKLARKTVRELTLKPDEKAVAITPANLAKYLGPEKSDLDKAKEKPRVGLVNGLSVTEMGGSLMGIEGAHMPGKGALKLTGRMGEVMKESAEIAKSYVRSICGELGIDGEIFDKTDIHIHAPEGAIKKDGPSAGTALTTLITSIYTDIPIRNDVAMTGEITLLGDVLPIGGLKEKLLGALAAGAKTVLIPQKNVKDLAEVPDNVKEKLTIVAVSHVSEVLANALVKKPAPKASA
ncbi:Lon protease [Alphaproteobacteria bacterium]|nr:Lon protease [Alphaproteobacteria bacterium]